MKNLYNKLVPFLRDIFLDLKESGKSFKDYFEIRGENIEAFKQTRVFKKHVERYKENGEITKVLFEKMTKDFNDGIAYLYVPNEKGEFSKEQNLIFFRLADMLTQKTGAPTIPPSPEETASSTSKRLEEAGNLKIIKQLKLNQETGLIEGEVLNPNDGGSKTLKLSIDPNNPDELIFKGENGEILFSIENTEGALGIFIGATSWEVMALSGGGSDGIIAEIPGEKEPLPKNPTKTGDLPTKISTETGDLPTKISTETGDLPTDISSEEDEQMISGFSPSQEKTQTETQAETSGKKSPKPIPIENLGKSSVNFEFQNNSKNIPRKPIYKQVEGSDQRLKMPEMEGENNQSQGRYTEEGLKKKTGKDEQTSQNEAKAGSEEEGDQQEQNKKSKGRKVIATIGTAIVGTGIAATTILPAIDII